MNIIKSIKKVFRRSKTDEEVKEELGDEPCKHCPWYNDEIPKGRISTCEGIYCDEALDNYKSDISNK